MQAVAVAAIVLQIVIGTSTGPLPWGFAILPAVSTSLLVATGHLLYRTLPPMGGGRPMRRVHRHLLRNALVLFPLWWFAAAWHLVFLDRPSPDGPFGWLAIASLVHAPSPDLRYQVVGVGWILSTQWISILLIPIWKRIFRRRMPRPAGVAEWAAVLTAGALGLAVEPMRPFLPILVGMAVAMAERDEQLSPMIGEVRRLIRRPVVVLSCTAGVWLLIGLTDDLPATAPVAWLDGEPILTVAWVAVAGMWCARALPSVEAAEADRWARRPGPAFVLGLASGVLVWHEFFLALLTRDLGTDAHLLVMLHLVLLGSAVTALGTRIAVLGPSERLLRRLGMTGASVWPPVGRASGAAEATLPVTVAPRRSARRPPIDLLRVAAGLLVIGGLFASMADLVPEPHVWPVVLIWTGAACWVASTTHLLLRSHPSTEDEAANGSSSRSRHLVSVAVLHWSVTAALLVFGAVPMPVDARGWYELVMAAPWRLDAVPASAPAQAVMMLIAAELWLRVLVIVIDLVGRSPRRLGIRAGTRRAAAIFGIAAIGAMLMARLDMPITSGLLLFAGAGALIAFVDLAQRARRGWLAVPRALVRYPGVALIAAAVGVWAVGASASAPEVTVSADAILGSGLAGLVVPTLLITITFALSTPRSPLGRLRSGPWTMPTAAGMLGSAVWFAAIGTVARPVDGTNRLLPAALSLAAALVYGSLGRWATARWDAAASSRPPLSSLPPENEQSADRIPAALGDHHGG